MDPVVQWLMAGGSPVVVLLMGIFIYSKIDKKMSDSVSAISLKVGVIEKERIAEKIKNEKFENVLQNIDMLEEVMNYVKNNTPVSEMLSFEIDRVFDLLNKNFSNGSSKQRALDDLGSFRVNMGTFVGDAKVEIMHREQYFWFIDVIHRIFEELVEELSHMTDYNVKPRLISGYSLAVNQLVAYYKVKELSPIFTSLNEKQLKDHLESKFKSFGTRRVYSQISGVKAV